MSERLCTFEGCGRKYIAKNLCVGHYRQQREGKELAPILRGLEARFWAKVDKTSDCWLWTGTKDSDGYGQICVNGRTERAHRVSLNLEGVEIGEGLQVDHMCKEPSCVRPSHLRLVTVSENQHNRSSTLSESGYRGVTRHGKSWQARQGFDGKSHYLGTYDTPEEAYETVQKFVKENGIIWDTREILASDQVIAS